MFESKAIKKSMPDFAEVVELYESSFPANERTYLWWLRLMACKKSVNFKAYYDEGSLVGLSFVSSYGNVDFLLYLAVSGKTRSKGYGGMILRKIREESGGRDIYLNIEPLDETSENYEQRKKRLDFYLRNGFKVSDYSIYYKYDVFTVLTTGEVFSPEGYAKAIRNTALDPFRIERNF